MMLLQRFIRLDGVRRARPFYRDSVTMPSIGELLGGEVASVVLADLRTWASHPRKRASHRVEAVPPPRGGQDGLFLGPAQWTPLQPDLDLREIPYNDFDLREVDPLDDNMIP